MNIIDKKIFQKYNNFPIQLKASFWFLVCAFLQRGISVITTPIFTRLLSASEYGKYNVFNSWLGIIGIFVSLQLSYGVYAQGLVKFEDDEKIYSSSLQGLSAFLVICWTIVYLLFREFWNQLFSLSTIQILALLLIIWTTAVFNFWASAQRVHYKYKTLVFITLLISIAKPAIGIFFVTHAKDKVTGRILGIALVELIGYSGLFWVQMLRGRIFYNARFWKHALLFNLPLIPHYLSQTVLNNADRIMIERMIGANAAGIYSLAYSVSLIMTLFNTALMQTFSPWIYKKIKAKKISDIASIAYITLIIIAMINIALIAFAPEIVVIFAPKTYYEAIWVIPPVAMSVFFMYSYDLFAKFAFYYEKTKFIMIASVVGATLNIILNYIFINYFEYQAAGYTTLCCYIIYDIGHYFFMNRVCDAFCDGVRPYDLKKILLITILFTVFGFGMLFTYNNFIVRYGVIIILCIITIVKRKNLKNMFHIIVEIKNHN